MLLKNCVNMKLSSEFIMTIKLPKNYFKKCNLGLKFQMFFLDIVISLNNKLAYKCRGASSHERKFAEGGLSVCASSHSPSLEIPYSHPLFLPATPAACN